MPGAPLVYSPPAITTTNVLYGTGIVFTAPVSTNLPSDQNLGVGSAWVSAGWSYIGATDQGVALNFNPSTVDIKVEEQPTPVATVVDSAQFTISFDISEETLNGINLAYGLAGTISVTAAGAGQPGKSVLNLSTVFPTMAAAIVGRNQLGFARVFSVPAVMSAGTVATSFRRSAAQRLWPVTLNATCPYASISIIDLTSVATS